MRHGRCNGKTDCRAELYNCIENALSEALIVRRNRTRDKDVRDVEERETAGGGKDDGGERLRPVGLVCGGEDHQERCTEQAEETCEEEEFNAHARDEFGHEKRCHDSRNHIRNEIDCTQEWPRTSYILKTIIST